MEIFDIVDENGLPTGETIERTQAHKLGIRHRTAHIWVVRKHEGKIQFLLQKRADDKESFPGQYDTSSAGHIHAGDQPLESALRELNEEIGICADAKDLIFVDKFYINYQKEFYGSMFCDNEVTFLYVLIYDGDISKLEIQKEELSEIRWFDMDYLDSALQPIRNEMFCVPVDGFLIAKKWCEENL